MSIHLKTD